jgi:hypothetical protein
VLAGTSFHSDSLNGDACSVLRECAEITGVAREHDATWFRTRYDQSIHGRSAMRAMA